MLHGFIPGSRANFTMDLIVTAMIIVIPVMQRNIGLAQQSTQRHAKNQSLLSAGLLVLILFFELEVRSIGWTHLIPKENQTTVYTLLAIHIFFSSTTLLLWISCIGYAFYNRLLNHDSPVRKRSLHRKMGTYTFKGMVATTLTGWVFYIAAFCI